MLEEGKIRVDLPSLEIKMSMKWELVVGCAIGQAATAVHQMEPPSETGRRKLHRCRPGCNLSSCSRGQSSGVRSG